MIAGLFPLLEDESSDVRAAAWNAVRTIDPDFAGLGYEMRGITDWRDFQHVHNWTGALDSTAYRIGKGSFGSVYLCRKQEEDIVPRVHSP